ncbi:putative MPP superfamily phosphohydrolase [Roseimicrobium gellanilyticum]|uniref:Putative MPP superfamily phosphohydrolase n=1 Tax=Roseimicrobium gellanilyticum TaxID=748857 RepID=A0A366HSR1_9BACT|nr:metallophosphoesterase [Roseimicrobium gellanilyticum]RBP45953.1 putative MPP superfamily phosphohydrolase [Roseimicrobium gellanilyticum]
MSVEIRRERVCLKSGGPDSGRLRMAHLSDFHVWWSSRRLDEVAAILDEEQPEVVVFTGDWFDTPRGADLCCDFLRRIASTRPVCWIRGNHDHWFGPEALEPFHGVSGAHCVDEMSWNFDSEWGLRCEFMSWQMHSTTARDSGRHRIVLVHDPEDLDLAKLPGCDLVLAGHLHGGQFVFHRTGSGTHFPANMFYRWCCDRREVDGVPVIISRGLGDTLPLRFRCSHEVVMIEMGNGA